MASTTSTTSLTSSSLAPSPFTFALLPEANAVRPEEALSRLQSRARFSQLAAQLQIRLKYAGYKAKNNFVNIPFATLEQSVQATHPSKPEQLLDALAGTKRPLSDSELMPPPPAPSLYNQLLDNRPQKRQKTDAQSSRAVGPPPTKFKDYSSPKPSPKPSKHHTHKSGTPSKSRKHHKHRSPYKKVVSSSSSNRKHSSTVPGSSKTAPTPREILALADKEEFNAAKTLASLMQSKKSPMISHPQRKPPSSRGSSVASGSSAPQQPSSQPPGAGGGRDEAADLLLLLANSPSPARTSQARRPGGEPAARVLFQDSIPSSKANGSGGGGSTASSSASVLLPPPSPLRHGSISGDLMLDPPPVHGDPFFSTPGSGSGLGASASLFPPTTPGTAKFNIADFLHFTPTPAFPASPIRSGGAAGGMGMGMPPGVQTTPIASVRRASGGGKAKKRKESASLARRTSTEELGKAKESPLTSADSVKSVGSDAERPPSSAVSTIAEDR